MGSIQKSIRLLYLALAVVFLASGASADSTSFTLESYIPEYFSDLEWQVGGNIDLSGNNSDGTVEDISDPDYIRETINSESDRSRLSVSTILHRRYITLPRWVDITLDFSGAYNRSTGESDRYADIYGDAPYPPLGERSYRRSESKSKNWNTGLGTATDVGIYVADDLFLSLKAEASTDYGRQPGSESFSWEHYTYSDLDSSIDRSYIRSYDRSSDQRNHRINLEFLPGWGRVYAADYAATALYIIDELEKEGLVLNRPTRGQMEALTDKIYYYRLKHAVDTRLHKIEALTEIMNFLHAERIIHDPGPYGHLLVTDVWDYFPGRSGRSINRQFGWHVRGGVGLDLQHSSRDATNIETYDRLTTRYYSGTGTTDTLFQRNDFRHISEDQNSTLRESYLTGLIEYFKPVNLRAQLDVAAQGYYVLDSYLSYTDWDRYYDTTGNIYSYDRRWDFEDMYGFSVTATGRYILDSRTDMRLTANLDYEHFTRSERVYYSNPYGTELDRHEQTISNWQYSLIGRLNYRLAIPTTITFGGEYVRGNYDLRPIVYIGYTEEDVSSYRLYVSIAHYLK